MIIALHLSLITQHFLLLSIIVKNDVYCSNLVFNDMVILYVVIFPHSFYLKIIGAGFFLFFKSYFNKLLL